MKKIILGLFLAVGFSATSFANTNLPTEEFSNENVASLDCGYGNTYVVTYCDGSRQTFHSYESGPCQEGMEDGQLNVLVKFVSGCGPQ